MTMDVPREISGPLPAKYADQLDFRRLEGFVEAALMRQPAAIRNRLLEWTRDHELEVVPFDDTGHLQVQIEGTPVLRLHWTRLMPGAPTT